MAENSGSGDFVAGFLLGAFVGAVLAFLFAPAPGEETREKLREKGIELRQRAEEWSSEAEQRARELQEKGKSALEQQKTRFREAVEEGKKAAERKKEELLREIEELEGDEGIDLEEQEIEV
ncbi:MAG: YtxH domain-containing protein [Chloroflexota bacterium]|nr:YtxH domain-containing protein [Chloroflexota bacterium]